MGRPASVDASPFGPLASCARCLVRPEYGPILTQIHVPSRDLRAIPEMLREWSQAAILVNVACGRLGKGGMARWPVRIMASMPAESRVRKCGLSTSAGARSPPPAFSPWQAAQVVLKSRMAWLASAALMIGGDASCAET